MKKTTGKIEILFDEVGNVSFDIKTTKVSELLIALMGIEGYINQITDLSATEIRELIDDEKMHVNVKPKEPDDDIVDVDVD